MVAKEKPSIAIRLDAGHEIGMGHLFRMMTLAKLFKKKGFDCIFIIRTNPVSEKILLENEYVVASFRATYTERNIVDRFFEENAPEPALWIFDILSTTDELVSSVKERGVPVVCFDDSQGGVRSADLVINAIVGCWTDRPPQNNRILSGPRYAIIPPEITRLRMKRKKKKPSEGLIKLGITMGGSDTHGATVKIIEVLQGMEGLHVFFFLGPHFMHHDELQHHCSQLSFPHTMKEAVKELHAELADMDIVLCGGGQTLFEISSMGGIILALANEEHERKTIAYFSKRGACVDLGYVKGVIHSNKIRRFIEGFRVHPENANRLGLMAGRLVDGLGAERCCEICIRVIHRTEIGLC